MELNRTREILNQLSSRGREIPPQKVDRRLLIVLTGTDNGMGELMPSLVKARGRGLRYRLALSRAAEGLLDINSLMLKLQPKELIREAEAIKEMAVLQDIDAVVVPLLTQNTAFKLCNGIQDQLIPRLLWQSLWMGKPIWMNLEGLRTYRGMMPASEAIKAMVEAYIAKLKSMGVMEIKDKTDIEALLQYMASRDLAEASTEEAKAAPAEALTASGLVAGAKAFVSTHNKKSIITEGDILKAPPQLKEIKVGGNSIITPLAYDTARRRGIKIIKA